MMTTTRCPICRAPVASPEAFPFCNERCRLIDLGRWLSNEYRIPGEAAPESDPESPHDTEKEPDECAPRS